ncbi:nucleotide sugar dehydrogenase [Sulfuricaulis sp.]|jgi:UDPglucose 6-dehydrogenase|uniref:nucleotide sugar dehydrogenase n=1 Tax=Sulfuricaulis sp. TaxID=2003553 RepID=UPI003559790D
MTKPVVGFAGMTHLGINSAAACAGRGFRTVCYDPDRQLVAQLESGKLPVVELGLPELMRKCSGLLSYSAELESLSACDQVYIAADVPTDDRGRSDLAGIQRLIDDVISHLGERASLVVLCQVPPGFTRTLPLPRDRLYYQVETLVFGRAVERALHPERIIVGCADPASDLPLSYREFLSAFNCPVLPMRYESAELAKIAINCCLVASVTVANTLAELSERIGADWHEIAPALRLDKRIGQHAYLTPGLGLAGGNLERDLATVTRLAEATGSEIGLIRAFVHNSSHRRDWVLRTLHQEVFSQAPDAVLAVLGLAYKENTHSTKNSPSLALIKHLAAWPLRLYDPVVPATAALHRRVTACGSGLDAASGADALVIMTPWPQFRELSVTALARSMKGRAVIDPYRVLEAAAVTAAGLEYFTIGVPPSRGTTGNDAHA